jgi:LysR family transcriptional regulator, glycine cleavage system transcriptional activator
MQSRFRRIQGLLTPLRVLEAAARLGSFTMAAAELGLSQPSVSRHIASLEHDLGTALFIRSHNKLALTAEGRTLANAVDLGMSHILTAVQFIATSPHREGLTLACTHSFAHGWLLPRFSSLRRATHGRPINLIVSYWLKDIVVEEVDLIVNWRTGGCTDWPRLPLFDEIIYPVCSPEYSRNLTVPLEPHSLRAAKLLDYEVLDDHQIGWKDWFAAQGINAVLPIERDLFSNYHFMIQAAMDGEGIALGWHHLVADQITQGRLVKIGPAFKRKNSSYALEYRQDRLSQASITPVLEWFQEQAAALVQPD